MMREVADKLKLAINGAVLRPGATLADYPRAFTPEKVSSAAFLPRIPMLMSTRPTARGVGIRLRRYRPSRWPRDGPRLPL
jgi:hypothetical protein